MTLDDKAINTLFAIKDEIYLALKHDYGISYESSVTDDDGFECLTVMIKFKNGTCVYIHFGLDTGNMITGDDSCDSVTGEAIWRQIAFQLLEVCAELKSKG